MKPKNLLLALLLPALILAGETQSNALPYPAGQPEKPDSSTSPNRSIAPSLSRPLAQLPQLEEHGIINISEIGAGFGLGDTDPDFSRSIVQLNTVFDYVINKNFLVGLGTGLNFYNGGAMIPFYIDGRYYLNEFRMTPFIVLDAGVMFSLDKFSSSGLFANPMVGVRRALNDKISFNLSLGGLVQNAPEKARNSFINFKGGVTVRL